MKYMLIMNSPRDGYTQYLSWPKKILEANMAFMGAMAQKLAASGELVSTNGLAAPSESHALEQLRVDRDDHRARRHEHGTDRRR